MATAPQRFSEFLVFLESVLTDEMRGIMPLVIKRYDACSRPFKNSNDMLTLLTTTKTDMQRDQRHMFIYLKDFLSELAAYQEREKMAAVKRKRDSDLSDEDDISGGESEKPDSKKGKTNPQPIPGAKESPGCGDGVLPNSCLSSSSAVKPVEHNGWIGGEGGGHSSETGSTHLQKGQDGLTSESTRGEVKDEDVDHKKKTRSSEPSGSVPQQKEVSEKHIRKLEKLLGKLRNEIEKVREKELSLDDLDAEDSSYIYEDRLEKKFVAVWNKLCLAKKPKNQHWASHRKTLHVSWYFFST
ncbi:uncharacterized protein LOC121383261 [Gigantopelta aegis]|uniref:uncharacterized protein LOC121383261 n=1 Tax=Gigantopelta aegis TaxID=1735272 RepID=UPI001B88C79C|nr:uncharacterized protein LOC121383261 [Gigantopelta aegis]XP_041369106.1 uncharacterized protein LOC121383261 [Gigantopelta aegis]